MFAYIKKKLYLCIIEIKKLLKAAPDSNISLKGMSKRL